MKRKLFILLFLICSITAFSKPSAPTILELRKEYLTALKDYLNAPKVYDAFLKVENPSAKMLAYQGALEAIMTKTTWNIFKKMNYLNKSEASFKKAILSAPDDLEIRFMRLAVQFEIPEYLGYSDDMQTDKEFILKHASSFDFKSIPISLSNQIIGFMNRCEKFTEEQIVSISKSLVTFQKN